MLIWLIKDGEHLPVQHGARRMRMWMLAAELVNRGHSVLWWSSTFSHQRKTILYNHDIEVEVKPHFKLKLIYSGAYYNNISFRRYQHHRIMARKFRNMASTLPEPEVIVCAFPTIDLAYEAVTYAKRHDIPIIVDIRDPWPDTFIEKSPRFLRGILKIMLSRDFKRTKYLLQDADCLVAISKGCLSWGLKYAERTQTDEDDKVIYSGYPDENTNIHEATERLQSIKHAIKGKIIFSFIGSFGYSYELQLICDVAQRLMEIGQAKVHFILAGDGQ